MSCYHYYHPRWSKSMIYQRTGLFGGGLSLRATQGYVVEGGTTRFTDSMLMETANRSVHQPGS
jgi:hypothetical protein